MDVVQAIRERKSIRAFKPDQVPVDLLKKILEDAFVKRGPTAMMNSQSEVPRPSLFFESYTSRVKNH